ncbi:DUF6913 domain-containing protein [Salinimicrobium sediminilitoris]|uniref:DUF6913 domain-containing protein n=1 Tax=Salinimicrobium sediminilitoris TaxID=2876715 RepID=UPI001E2B94F1|nr:hypothetical protein [Salinimicrobium sediminilitoris]MCC8361259.1 hypothetical protein [Salinimicrobium sediminilitoris]
MKIKDLKLAVARKNLRISENSVAEGKVYKLGIILDDSSEDTVKHFLKLKEDLNLKQQEVKFVFCEKKAVKIDTFEWPEISREDFRWNGKVSEKASAFIDAQFDVLVSFTASENKMAGFLVSVTRARLKVGREKTSEKTIFDLNISAELSEAEIFTEELKKYLKILNTTT